MKGPDKFLIGIVVGVVLLVAVAFGVALLGPKPTYRAEDTPEGVAHNYLLALRQEDYARAYGYLSPTLAGYPASLAAFIQDLRQWSSYQFNQNRVTLEVQTARPVGAETIVTVRETIFNANGLFDSQEYTNIFEMRLQREATAGAAPPEAWKIIGSDSYWSYCWDIKGGCP